MYYSTTQFNPVMEQKQNQKQRHDCVHFTCNGQLHCDIMVVHEWIFDTPHRGHTPTDTGSCRKIWKACAMGRRPAEWKACLSRRCSAGWKTWVAYCCAEWLLYPGFVTQLGRAPTSSWNPGRLPRRQGPHSTRGRTPLDFQEARISHRS